MRGCYYNELDPYAAQWLRNLIAAGHIAAGDVDERSIEDVEPADIAGYSQCHFFAGIGVWSYALRLAGWPDDKPIWTGSAPCQPFSAAGKQKGFDDQRHLWPEFYRLIAARNPELVVGEQVPAAVRLGWLDSVFGDLERAGYASGAIVLGAHSVGAPHIRQRLYWMAHANGKRGEQGDADERWRHPGSAARQEPGPVGGRVPDGLGHTRDPRSQEQRRQRDESPRPAAHGVSFGLADAHCNRCDQAGIGVATARNDGLVGDRAARGMGDAHGSGAGWDGRAIRGAGAGEFGQHDADDAFASSADRRPRPTDGFWRDSDWLFCRDGKWRPVVATHCKVVDGIAAGLGRVRASEGDSREEEINGELQGMRSAACPKALFKRGSGGAVDAETPPLLRPEVHGALHAERCVPQPESQPEKVASDMRPLLRDMRSDGAASCAPHRPQPAQQHALELEDVVRLLSPSLSLAELYGDRRTAEALHLLQRRIREKRPVQYAPDALEAVWASLGEEEKNEIRLDFDASRWAKVVTSPLERDGQGNRKGRLKGYGNAIVAPLAAEFIRSVVSTLGERNGRPCQ